MEKALLSTGKDEWGTPQELYDALNKEFNFTLDPCSSDTNYKHINHFTAKENGLLQNWGGNCVFCNPPYSKPRKGKAGQIDWVKKCYEEHKNNGITVVMLLPARTDTVAFHDYILGKAEIRFIKGRLKFELERAGQKDAAPFPSMIVIDQKGAEGQVKSITTAGKETKSQI